MHSRLSFVWKWDRGSTRCSLLPSQLSAALYAIKIQLWDPKTKRVFACASRILYGRRIGGFRALEGPIIGALMPLRTSEEQQAFLWSGAGTGAPPHWPSWTFKKGKLSSVRQLLRLIEGWDRRRRWVDWRPLLNPGRADYSSATLSGSCLCWRKTVESL